jgi:predicted outer membrane repeat protein
MHPKGGTEMSRPIGSVLPAVLTVAFVVVLAASLSAATWHVKADGSGDVATIMAAVSAAASGDTILLADGTFSGNGNRDIPVDYKSLTVRSASGDPDLCIIDCGGSAPQNHLAFDIRFDGTPPVVLDGVTIRGGYNSSAGAVYIAKSSTAAVTATLKGCKFSNNHSDWEGGAIIVTSGCSVTAMGCTFSGGTASYGAAVTLMTGSPASTFTGCTFSDNTASGVGSVGGAISMSGTAAVLDNCVLTGNSAGMYGGAIYCEENSTLGLTGCTLSANSSPGSGGAIFCEESALSLTGCVSLRNSCDGLGASVYCATGASVEITSCSFVADSVGNAVILCNPNVSPAIDKTVIAFAKTTAALACLNPPGTPTVTCSDIFGNDLGDWTGCIAGLAGSGGNLSSNPLFCDIPSGDVTYETCSPCLAGNNTCGHDIGATPSTGCSCGGAIEATTWGAIKALYK